MVLAVRSFSKILKGQWLELKKPKTTLWTDQALFPLSATLYKNTLNSTLGQILGLNATREDRPARFHREEGCTFLSRTRNLMCEV